MLLQKKSDLKIHMETQRTVKTILKKEEQNWNIHTSQFQNLLQNYNNQGSVSLV